MEDWKEVKDQTGVATLFFNVKTGIT